MRVYFLLLISLEIISIVNQKGGVGKTTTAVNLATAFASVYKKVLIIDFDPQGNASTGVGIAKADRSINCYHMLLEDIDFTSSIMKTKIPNLDIISSDPDLAYAEVALLSVPDRELVLKKKLAPMRAVYDYIIIDCPPSLGALSINALVASNSIIIPVQCEFYALEGLSHLLNTIERIKANFNAQLFIRGILLTMYDKRSALCLQVSNDLRNHFKDLVFDNVIPRNVKVSESPSHGLPVLIYDVRSAGSTSYIHVVGEILRSQRNEDAAA